MGERSLTMVKGKKFMMFRRMQKVSFYSISVIDWSVDDFVHLFSKRMELLVLQKVGVQKFFSAVEIVLSLGSLSCHGIIDQFIEDFFALWELIIDLLLTFLIDRTTEKETARKGTIRCLHV